VMSILMTLFFAIFSKTNSATNNLNNQNQIFSKSDLNMSSEFARAAACRNVEANFRPSLEMMESVDYLLSPALIIQGSLNNSVIPTYPSE
jgi:hypothetical protein